MEEAGWYILDTLHIYDMKVRFMYLQRKWYHLVQKGIKALYRKTYIVFGGFRGRHYIGEQSWMI